MPAHHIAQFNYGRLVADQDDPVVAPFMDALDEINALAEATPGFVWRLQDERGNATGIRIDDDPRVAINLSVWESIEQLHAYVYRSGHTSYLSRRREWFEPLGRPHQVLWWIAAGELPSVADALERLAMLERDGPTATAFTFAQRFEPPLVAVG